MFNLGSDSNTNGLSALHKRESDHNPNRCDAELAKVYLSLYDLVLE